MKKIALITTLILGSLWGTEAFHLFNTDDKGIKHLEDDSYAKEVTFNNISMLMTPDGDLVDEDVATIEDEVVSLVSSKKSFRRSKRILATKIYNKHRVAFYSGCTYRVRDKKLVPTFNSCGYKVRKSRTRARRIEWEHIVPAHRFGRDLRCWNRGGRGYCRTSNKKFAEMEADMHNLVPAIGEINGDRSNFPYGEVPNEPRAYGKTVDMEISFKLDRAEAPDNRLGDIARVYLYMNSKYDMPLEAEELKRLISWNNSDAVDEWEIEKNNMVKTYQGDDNPFVSDYKKLDVKNFKSVAIKSNSSSSESSSFDKTKGDVEKDFEWLLKFIPAKYQPVVIIILAILVMLYRRRKK
ncbi:Endonuclease I precursor [hydrothermal vent metagenome]|uniref:Endonuclease I n=1 Tax=hydrothermal vent metagenome TaxID=652676 RepID=A0A1W1CGS5_9ZZZZ